MSFNVSVSLLGERCDICNKLDNRPMFYMNQRTRIDKNVIFAHVECLTKRLRKACDEFDISNRPAEVIASVQG